MELAGLNSGLGIVQKAAEQQVATPVS